MANKSIFDIEHFDENKIQQSERTQVVYDDDLFAFGETEPCNDSSENTNFLQIKCSNEKADETKQRSKSLNKRKFIYNINAQNPNAEPITKRARVSKHQIRNVISQKQQKTDSLTEYSLLKLIGKGTYGEVFKGQMNKSRQIIAVKRISVKFNDRQKVNFIGG